MKHPCYVVLHPRAWQVSKCAFLVSHLGDIVTFGCSQWYDPGASISSAACIAVTTSFAIEVPRPKLLCCDSHWLPRRLRMNPDQQSPLTKHMMRVRFIELQRQLYNPRSSAATDFDSLVVISISIPSPFFWDPSFPGIAAWRGAAAVFNIGCRLSLVLGASTSFVKWPM